MEIANIIIPSCLRVDNAITFFKSYSKIATMPDISIVAMDTTIKIVLQYGSNKKENRISK